MTTKHIPASLVEHAIEKCDQLISDLKAEKRFYEQLLEQAEEIEVADPSGNGPDPAPFSHPSHPCETVPIVAEQEDRKIKALSDSMQNGLRAIARRETPHHKTAKALESRGLIEDIGLGRYGLTVQGRSILKVIGT